ncbi:hypothetical protein [Hahella ganghwensis]|uniref:hypothetical protein n=1 Tax=Hahella ganghwensis TaxID=286420 RepID=UPI00035EB663|nr:hypothetical protein [Hahella ganghwensis]
MNYSIGICVLSDNQRLIEQLDYVFSLIHAIQHPDEDSNTFESEPFTLPPRNHRDVFNATVKQARLYLSQAGKRHHFTFTQLRFSTLDEAIRHLQGQDSDFDLFIVDSERVSECAKDTNLSLSESPFEQLISASNVRTLTPYSKVMLVPADNLDSILSYVDGSAQIQVLQDDPDIDRANLLKLLIDHLEHGYLNKLLSRTTAATKSTIGLAKAIFGHMQERWKGQWDFHYYTGSMVANLIRSIQALCNEAPETALPRCLTGNNEHSLAAGALAGWQLFDRAYVIAVTSGMIDEFRGTLANLHRARAPGLIICADSPAGSWFAFQGTIDADTDGRDVIAARRIPHVYLHDHATLAEQLSKAFQMMNESQGPVFVFATPNVLESRENIPYSVYTVDAVDTISSSPCNLQQSDLDAVMDLINHSDIRLLWNCGPVSDYQRSLIYQIAHEAGIALADSLTHPGTVQAYSDGQINENYLGTFGVYAFSRRIFHYLHDDGKVCGPDSLSQFFLKSKIDQASTPFSEGKLKRNFHIVQVNKNERHLSPYSDIALQIPLTEFLEYVKNHLDVQQEIRNHRLEHLTRVKKLDEGVPADYMASLPMSVNYFTLKLGQQIRQLIEQEDFRYIGVYDVGRCGLSAIRNIPRTDRGFSGWYGRALMGDALSALPYIARTSKHNVLAFIGDGARALVPNIENQLVQALAHNPNGCQINVTLLYLCNGVLSMIQTYLDKRTPSGCGRQVIVPLPLQETYPEQENEPAITSTVPVYRTRLSIYQEQQISDLLCQKGRINVAKVLLSHNSDGDGLSLFSESSWHRITV